MQSKNILKALICVSLVCGKSQTILLFNSRQTKPRWLLNLGDFANMVKAFVGSSYLNTAYGFKQSGVAVSVVRLRFCQYKHMSVHFHAEMILKM